MAGSLSSQRQAPKSMRTGNDLLSSGDSNFYSTGLPFVSLDSITRDRQNIRPVHGVMHAGRDVLPAIGADQEADAPLTGDATLALGCVIYLVHAKRAARSS
jgi:hypothetical protein